MLVYSWWGMAVIHFLPNEIWEDPGGLTALNAKYIASEHIVTSPACWPFKFDSMSSSLISSKLWHRKSNHATGGSPLDLAKGKLADRVSTLYPYI